MLPHLFIPVSFVRTLCGSLPGFVIISFNLPRSALPLLAQVERLWPLAVATTSFALLSKELRVLILCRTRQPVLPP